MKRLLFSLSLLVLLSQTAFAQKHPKCKLIDEYGSIFHADYYESGEFKTIFLNVDSLADKHCLAALINPQHYYVDYLLQHFANVDRDGLLLLAQDSVALQKKFIQDLQKNEEFNGLMQDFTARFFDPSIAPQHTYTIDNVVGVAVKFFNVNKITPEGYYSGKVCVGINGITSTETDRNPQLEAFCFATVFKHYQSPEFNLQAEFVRAIKDLYKIKLGVDEKERLLRAQGAMFFMMRDNAVLRAALMREYELAKAHLPFLIKA